jgi:UDP-N-acetylglucosamine 4,6-dehydratase/5-epimerase
MFTGAKITTTGGTGSWGQEFAKQLLDKGAAEVRIFSRNECAQVLMKHQFNDDRLKFIIGDIREFSAIDEACQGADYVIHCAALKHGNKCEEQPREAVKTNIYGVQNVIDACIKNKVKVCANISSDKACNSSCFYGKTKGIIEGLITEANNQTLDTDFISIRSGNILGSSASVVPIWIKQIKENNAINLSGKDMRRFFITPKMAVEYTLEAMSVCDRGEIFALRMPVFRISDLAEVLIGRYGDEDTKIVCTGRSEWERDVEWLVTEHEAPRTEKRKHFYVIYPTIKIKTLTFPVIEKPVSAICMDGVPDASPKLLVKMLKSAGY